jgi:hypothetical protein
MLVKREAFSNAYPGKETNRRQLKQMHNPRSWFDRGTGEQSLAAEESASHSGTAAMRITRPPNWQLTNLNVAWLATLHCELVDDNLFPT